MTISSRTEILYTRESNLDVAEFRRVLTESGLGTTRPVDDVARLTQMLTTAGLVITARLAPDGPIIGVVRCITDFAWCCYVSELAVTQSAQGLGVGNGLLDAIRRELGPRVSVFLASVPDAIGFYEWIGMPRLPDAFCYRRTE